MNQLPSGVINDEIAAIDILDGVTHAKVLRKLDWHLLPLIATFYFFCFLDRTNIGNARIAGMAKDLHLVGLRYNIAAAVFFVPYCVGQVPSNILLKLFRPSRWIPVIMFCWGLVMTLMCLVKTYPQLVIARIFLGIAEAGLVPAVVFYISLWYPRAELARRLAIYISAATLAGAFSGILAYAIQKMEGIGGLHGWQWIFCLEGLATVLVALVSPFFIYDDPDKASFLTPAERGYVAELMKADSQGLATHFSFRFVLQAFRDYKTYLQFVILFGLATPVYAIGLFTPTIIHELGFTAANAQLLSVPPWVAGCLANLVGGICSDRHKLRGPFVVGGAVLAIAGFLILYLEVRPGAAIVGVVIAAMGTFPPLPVCLAWLSSNAGGDVKRSIAIAIVTSLINTAGIAASFMFFDPPRFHVGLGISMGVLGCSVLVSLFTMWDYHRLNKAKERWCNERGITDDHQEEFKERGDDSPLFRYSL